MESRPADSRPVEAVTFDVGGTLIEPWPSVGHIYAEAASKLGLSAARLAHVGDNLEMDAQGAAAAGWLGLQIRREGGDPEENSLSDLRQTITRIVVPSAKNDKYK
jgi:FMN phosphatase YigB (HAD superfamily)